MSNQKISTNEDISLTKDEIFSAIKYGVKEAILEMTESGDGFSGLIRTDQFMEMIRQGTSDAIWRIATNATLMPSHDFYDMIKEGVKEGIEGIDISDSVKKNES